MGTGIKTDSNKSRSLVYWHSEGLVSGFDNEELRLTTNSANLIDFLLIVAEHAAIATISGPTIKARKDPVFLAHAPNTTIIQGKLNLSDKLTTFFSIPVFIHNLFFGEFSKALRTSDLSVSVGLSGTGTLVGYVRSAIFSRPHAFIVRGDRLKTIAGSSRSQTSKQFATMRIKFYEWLMRRLTNQQKAEIWFQGGGHREKMSDTMPSSSKVSLKVLNAVLRDLPEPKIAPKKYDLIYVGRITQEKGIIELLQAVKSARTDGVVLSLCIIGKGPDEKLVKDTAAEFELTEQIFWKGFVSDSFEIVELLSRSRVFVLPSYTEGLPRSLLEAMWVGIPCITTPVGGIPLLFHDNKSIFFIPPRDAQALAYKLKHVLELEAKNSLSDITAIAKSIARNCSFKDKAQFFISEACKDQQ